MRTLTVVVIVILTGFGAFFFLTDDIARFFFRPIESTLDNEELSMAIAPEAIVEGLRVPWEVVVLPGGEFLVTERPGSLLRIGEDRQTIEIQGVADRGEGGLLGLALHPDFEENGWVYLYLTSAEGGALMNRVERYALEDSTLSERTVILEGIPGAANHDGGRIVFGPDGMLYVSTGDAGVPKRAQDTQNLAGKILRVTDEGAIPSDNPFGNAVYSYGHRNVQGLVWDEVGRLWATEHGRSGIRSGYDELNRIEKGANYGWPEVEGDETAEGIVAPEIHSGASETWAPAGIAYAAGRVFFAGLRGETLYSADVSGGGAHDLRAHLHPAVEAARLDTYDFLAIHQKPID